MMSELVEGEQVMTEREIPLSEARAGDKITLTYTLTPIGEDVLALGIRGYTARQSNGAEAAALFAADSYTITRVEPSIAEQVEALPVGTEFIARRGDGGGYLYRRTSKGFVSANATGYEGASIALADFRSLTRIEVLG